METSNRVTSVFDVEELLLTSVSYHLGRESLETTDFICRLESVVPYLRYSTLDAIYQTLHRAIKRHDRQVESDTEGVYDPPLCNDGQRNMWADVCGKCLERLLAFKKEAA